MFIEPQLESVLAHVQSESSSASPTSSHNALWFHIHPLQHFFTRPGYTSSVYGEVVFAGLQDRYLRRSAQVTRYIARQIRSRKVGGGGLRATSDRFLMGGFVVRDTHHPSHAAVNELWWDHIGQCDCLNDQVALHFTQQLRRDVIGTLPHRLWSIVKDYDRMQRHIMDTFDAIRQTEDA